MKKINAFKQQSFELVVATPLHHTGDLRRRDTLPNEITSQQRALLVAVIEGKYSIPLLLDIFWAANVMNDHTIDVMSGRDEVNSDRIPEGFMVSFCTGIVTTIEKMHEAGYENAPDLAFELILPHMDFLLCTLYARFGATMCGIDLISLYPNALNPENPDDLHDTLEAFLKYARTKNAKWSIRITEKALRYA